MLSVSSYPPRTIRPVASALASDLTEYNWWGRTYLHLREGDERRAHLEGLILGIKLELSAIGERQAALREEKKSLEATAAMYAKMKEELRQAQEEEKELRHQARELKENRVVRAGLKAHGMMSKLGAFASPQRQPGPPTHPPSSAQLAPIDARSTSPEERPAIDDYSDDDDLEDEEPRTGKDGEESSEESPTSMKVD